MLTQVDVANQLRRLAAVYKASDDVSALADAWFGVLRNTSPAALDRAVGQYLGSDARFFPKPGQIRRLASDLSKDGDRPDGDLTLHDQYWRWQNSAAVGDGEPCPVCGSALEQRDGRLNVWHDRRRHTEVRIGYGGNTA